MLYFYFLPIGNVHSELLKLFVLWCFVHKEHLFSVQWEMYTMNSVIFCNSEFVRKYLLTLFTLGSRYRVSEFCRLNFFLEFLKFYKKEFLSMQIYAPDSLTFLLWGGRFKSWIELKKHYCINSEGFWTNCRLYIQSYFLMLHICHFLWSVHCAH